MRFKPTTYTQLATLEDQDIDLFDYPLDYEVVQEGDYYDDGVTPAETMPWLYAVVPINFVTPSGITSELLQRLHVPDDYRVEDKAFQLTGNNVDTSGCATATASTLTEECDCDTRNRSACECRQLCGLNACTPPPPDLVGNYSNQQFLNALASDISSLPAYRERLISLNPNNQTPDVVSLFSFYNY